MRKLFEDQRQEVLGNLEDHWEEPARQARLDGMKTLNVAVDAVLFDASEARKLFRLRGRKLMQANLEQAGQTAADRYDLGRFSITEPSVQRWLDEKAFRFANFVNQETEEALREVLKEGVAAGDSIGTLSKKVAEVFDQAEGYRSERIARTETVAVTNRGAMDAYEQSGVVQKGEWITARDGSVRESHQIDGQERNLGQPFTLADGVQMDYPGDPDAPPSDIINCRCATAPVIDRG